MLRRTLRKAFSARAPCRHCTSLSSAGVAFDVDGVVIRGKNPVPGAADALRRLQQHGVPYIFVTNSSGVTEAAKAASLSRVLDLEVLPEQMQLASTPLRDLAEAHRDQIVLFVGKDSAGDVATAYGFDRALTSAQYHLLHPDLYPDIAPDESLALPSEDVCRGAVSAILVVADPIPWGRDLQICCDLLRSNGHPETRVAVPEGQLPIFFSTADFEYSAEFPLPRFGSGSFLFALRALYEEVAGVPLRYTLSGKPERVTFEHAQRTLNSVAAERGIALRSLFMVGDNPLSDIRGANAAGEPWSSVLVRTGIFQGGENDGSHPADFVAADISEAVQLILERAAGSD